MHIVTFLRWCSYNTAATTSASCGVGWRGRSETSLHRIQSIIIILSSPCISVNHDLGHKIFSSQYHNTSGGCERHFFWWKLEKAIGFTLAQLRTAKETLVFQKWNRKCFAKADQCAGLVVAQVVIVVVHILLIYVFCTGLKNLNKRRQSILIIQNWLP